MNPEKLYNVKSLDEWEELLDGATDADCRTVIIILMDYLRWIPKGYMPRSIGHAIEAVTRRPFPPPRDPTCWASPWWRDFKESGSSFRP